MVVAVNLRKVEIPITTLLFLLSCPYIFAPLILTVCLGAQTIKLIVSFSFLARRETFFHATWCDVQSTII